MKEEELKKYLCAVRIIIDRVFKGLDNAALILDKRLRKHMHKLTSGVDVTSALNEMHDHKIYFAFGSYL